MTKTQIANLALSHLGEPPSADIDSDTTTAASTVNTHYENTLCLLLETHPWNFARKIARLTPDNITLTVDAIYPWTAQYSLPTDCLRVLRFDLGGETSLQRFEVLDRKMLCNHDGTLSLYYITKSPAEDSLPPSFINAFSLLLASDIARQITGNDQIAGDFLQKHKIALNQALTKDTRETQSGENMTPRKLAMKSGLYRSRFRSHGAPGFDL